MKQDKSTGRATIKTVAKHAGVSVPAVSKVLRKAYGVSDALRQRVEASILELGYRPNTAARAMRGQTFTVGILLVEIANPFLQLVVDGVNDVLVEAGYKTLFGIGQSKVTMETSLIEGMISHQMDGLIVVAPQLHGDDLARYAKQIPMVVIGHHEATATTFDTVNSDDQEGAAIAVRELLRRGYRDIAMLTMARPMPDLYNVDGQRESGFRKAMAKSGVTGQARIYQVPWDVVERPVEISRLLKRKDRPRALFCWSDLDAVRVLEAAKKANIRVPEDLAIVGYDNSSVAQMAFVELASIDQSGHRMGSLAAETLLSRIQGRHNANHLLIEPTFIERRSIGTSQN
jgi:LacI family transcriptional regulator